MVDADEVHTYEFYYDGSFTGSYRLWYVTQSNRSDANWLNRLWNFDETLRNTDVTVEAKWKSSGEAISLTGANGYDAGFLLPQINTRKDYIVVTVKAQGTRLPGGYAVAVTRGSGMHNRPGFLEWSGPNITFDSRTGQTIALEFDAPMFGLTKDHFFFRKDNVNSGMATVTSVNMQTTPYNWTLTFGDIVPGDGVRITDLIFFNNKGIANSFHPWFIF
jgi:hypothetical protein